MKEQAKQQGAAGLVRLLQRKLLAADFDGAMQLIARNTSTPDGDELHVLRLTTMTSEVFDYSGRFDDAAAAINADGIRCTAILQNVVDSLRPPPATDAARRLLKQQIWAVLNWGVVFYRAGDFQKARSHFRLAREVALSHLDSGGYHAYGTLARVHYLMGLVDREMYDYRAAKHHFTESILYAWKSFDVHDSDLDAAGRTAVLTDINIARCLGLGLAWLHYAEGNTALAIPLLLAAREILSFKKDKLISCYIDVVYASALRSDRGDEPPVLGEVIRTLVRSLRVFRAAHHHYYFIRALHQLSRAYIQRARNAPRLSDVARKSLRYAERHARAIKQLSRAMRDYRFESHALVVRSQVELYRGRPLEAESLAREALEAGYEDTGCRIEALFARGAARIEVGNYDGACRNFEDALSVGGSNPKVAALAHVFLSRAYALCKDMRESSQHFAAWTNLKTNVCTAYMRQLESAAVAARKQETADFTVLYLSDKLDPKEEENRLHAFLVKWAKERTANDAEAMELLGISKQTFYNWQKAGPKARVLD